MSDHWHINSVLLVDMVNWIQNGCLFTHLTAEEHHDCPFWVVFLSTMHIWIHHFLSFRSVFDVRQVLRDTSAPLAAKCSVNVHWVFPCKQLPCVTEDDAMRAVRVNQNSKDVDGGFRQWAEIQLPSGADQMDPCSRITIYHPVNYAIQLPLE